MANVMGNKKTTGIKKALKDVIIDFLKSLITVLLTFIGKFLWNVYGAAVLLVLSLSLVGFAKWLNIPVTLPAYIVSLIVVGGMAVTLIIVIISRNAHERTKSVKFQGLLWLIDNKGNIVGPKCLKCKSNIENDSNLEKQLDIVTHVLFGQRPQYSLKCSRGHPVILDRSISELRDEVRTQFFTVDNVDKENEGQRV
jgi:hypothetical protein